MLYLIVKAAISGIIIALVSETAKHGPALGALISSVPLVSVLAVIWLWRDTSDSERIASQLQATIWYILPTLPIFLVMPMLLQVACPSGQA